MYSTNELYNTRVFLANRKGVVKRYGRIRAVVFHPNMAEALGVIVKRPDLALMVKRKDRFVAFDRLALTDAGLQIIDKSDTWDGAACKRLGVEYEKCILWDMMPVRTVSGRELGEISDVAFDEETRKVDHIDISSGAIDRKVLGSANISRSEIRGFQDGAIIVVDDIGPVEVEGGAAAAAGEAWAKTKHKASAVSKDAAAKTGTAVNQGARKLGNSIGDLKNAIDESKDNAKQAAEPDKPADDTAAAAQGGSNLDKATKSVGKQLGKASHMFQDFKDEFDKASRGE